jgi:hypothetical protein
MAAAGKGKMIYRETREIRERNKSRNQERQGF